MNLTDSHYSNILTVSPTIYDYRFHRPIIYSVIGVFTIFGMFGNVNLIVVHFRKSSLRTKYGILLCSLSIFQTGCLLFEWVGITYTLLGDPLYRSICFYLLFIYIFVHSLQTGMLATISLDLLISVVFPIKHRKVQNYGYCFIICTPAIIYGVISVSLGFYYLDNVEIKMCNPPSSLQAVANSFWYLGALIAGGVVIVNYSLAYIVISIKSRRDRDPLEMERRAMRSLSVILFVFVFSRYIGVFVSNLLIFTNANPALISLYQSYNAFFACALYSQNFYISYWRSQDYRNLLKEQLIIFLLKIWPHSNWLMKHLPSTPIFTMKSRHSVATTVKY